MPEKCTHPWHEIQWGKSHQVDNDYWTEGYCQACGLAFNEVYRLAFYEEQDNPDNSAGELKFLDPPKESE